MTMLQHQLSICAIFQDEADYLAEWIEFHLAMGVDHFYLYDNRSQDNPAAVLDPYLSSACVTLTDWPDSFEQFAQAGAFNDCLRRFGDANRWIAFLDIDEFLFSPEFKPLGDVLNKFTDAPAVVVNWQVYGSSGHDRQPDGLVLESYLNRAPEQWVRNRRLKTIAQPSQIARMNGPHFGEYHDERLAVNENHQPCRVSTRSKARGSLLAHTIQRGRNAVARRLTRLFPRLPLDPFDWTPTSLKQVSVSKLRINHYATKSLEAYERRMNRRRIPGEAGSGERVHNRARFDFQNRNEVHDPVLQPWAEKIRLRLLRRSAEPAPPPGKDSSGQQ